MSSPLSRMTPRSLALVIGSMAESATFMTDRGEGFLKEDFMCIMAQLAPPPPPQVLLGLKPMYSFGNSKNKIFSMGFVNTVFMKSLVNNFV